VLYVAYAPAAAWQPRPADSATLTVLPDGRTRAVHNAGAGPFALRHRFEPPPDLAQTPVLEVPLRQGPGTEQNLHLEIGGRSFLVRISAPLSGMKALLTPEFERGECFRLPVMPEAAVRERYLLGEAATADGHLRFDLGKALQDKGIQLPHLRLTVLTLGNTSNTGYRLAGGEGCNPAGAFVEVGEPRLLGRD